MWSAIVLVMIGIISLTATAAMAAPAATAGPVFASVDMSKIIANYSKRASADDAFKSIQDQYSDVFKTQTANAMLDADDQAKLGALLLLGDSATPDQKQQIADLETQSGKASDSLAALQQEKDASDADKLQLQQLTQQQQQGQAALQEIADQYRQTLDQKNQDMSADIAAQIRIAVGEVAKAQGITVVFDNSVAIYAPIDLTQSIIEKLAASK
jgi:Skp family chaperone for outer membrane proteins